MKKRIFKLVCLISVLGFSSCNDALELDATNSISQDQFYTSAENLEAGLYGIYDALQLPGVFGLPAYLEGMSDNCISDPTFRPDIYAYASGNQVVASSGIVDMYQDNYILIERANLLLDNIDGITGITEDDRETIRSEARTLRAFAYTKLAYLFSDVALIETFVERVDALSVEKTSQNEVLQFVLDELEETAEILTNAPAGTGRLTKQAVLGMRAKVMLFEARLGNQTWNDALSAINLAITEADNGGHMLIDNDNPSGDYQSLFTESNEGNAEMILAVSNSTADSGIDFKEDYSWQAGTLDMHIHQNLADAYGYADGTDYDPADDTYVGRDPRLSTNVMHEGLTFGGETYDGTNAGEFVGGNSTNSATNLFFNKLVTTDFVSTFNFGSLDIPVLRYADLLLMQAEALNETGGDAYAPVNAVRDRAGLPDLAGLSQSELRDAIILERRLELALEGHRWYDLITLGIAEEVINAIDEESAAITRAFTSGRSELLPIPQTELALNPNLLPQNPGYN